jgi:hypothetical protein
MHTKFSLESLKGRDHLEDVGGNVWTGFIWLTLGTSDGLS